jgi:hypothetical protein
MRARGFARTRMSGAGQLGDARHTRAGNAMRRTIAHLRQ